MISANVRHESWKIRGAFTTSHGSKTQADVVVVEFNDGKHRGLGECVPYPRYNESVSSVIGQINSVLPEVLKNPENEALQLLLPAGAARNAVDCALWDLRCKREGKRIWELLGLSEPQPLETSFTLSNPDLEALARDTVENAFRPLLKIKLFGFDNEDRVSIVRQNAPDSRLIVDANEWWTIEDYERLMESFTKHQIGLIEQPFSAVKDCNLGIKKPHLIDLCADESCHSCEDIPRLCEIYDYINIKLDKTGGLTEALAMVKEAKKRGLKIMVGCIVGTSLAMAPAFIVAQHAEFCDLDGPLLLEEDREFGIRYDGSLMHPPQKELWG